ncbi:hypothetical protein K503DRAFT_571068 [Rhizopogon vinicolor AM-OR11-026]|uniref:NACHT domain-containing protein n=1 Tax=Rhizopogon vinicolor AM-OR11-026 TaxID=1314800 RepID=A0A1B7MJW4_9AGAM|nr:hypothetical protein K503DRAFT_571068 [Rhizopogon vinicolor AM-OR11-026]
MNYTANRTLVADTTNDETIFTSLSASVAHGALFDSRLWDSAQKRECLEGTRMSIFEQIEGALQANKSTMIWLSGSPGTGKSAIAHTLARRLKNLETSRLAGTFFFSRKHKDMSGKAGLDFFVPTLAYQIAKSKHMAKDIVVNAIRSDPAILDPRKPLADQFQDLIVKPLENVQIAWERLEPKVLVIDAIDACEEDRICELISCLSDLLRQPRIPTVHILITSRPLDVIDDAFEATSCEESMHRIILDDVDVDEIHKDICLLFKRALERNYRNYGMEHLESKLEDETILCLADKANGRFGAASAMMRFLEVNDDDIPCDFEEKLKIMKDPGDEYLDSLQIFRFYEFIINSSENPLRAYRHLSTVVNLAEPLAFPELRKLLGSLERDLLSILVSLSPIVRVPVDDSCAVEVLHKESLRAFLSTHSSEFHALQLLAHSSLRMMRDSFICRSDFKNVLQRMMTQIPIQVDPPPGGDKLMNFLESCLEQPCYEAFLASAWCSYTQSGPGTRCNIPYHAQPCDSIPEDIPKARSALKEFQPRSEFHDLQVFELLIELEAQPEMLFIVILWAIRHAHPSASHDNHSTNGSSISLMPSELDDIMRYVRKGIEQSSYSSTALRHACQYWSSYLSQAQMITDGRLRTFFRAFWKDKLLSWFERQWYLGGLESCIAILHVAQDINFNE